MIVLTMQLTFLEASSPLTKTFTQTPTGIQKTPYPMTWEFTSHDVHVKDMKEFATQLIAHAKLGHCLLKGNVRRPLVRESRAGSTDSSGSTEFIVLDIDGLPVASNTTITDILNHLGLGGISYVIQWSSSYKIENSDIRAHVFMQLDKQYAAPLLKQWLIHLNHTSSIITSAMSLTKTGNAIRWPLDVSACQNDKLLYITAPILKGIKDPMGKTPRIQYVAGRQDKLVIDGTFSSEKNRQLTAKRVDELRERDNLPKRKFTTKMHGQHEILIKPDACAITEMKVERGFVYFNLNGGDSWAYYHPENNPEFILNFKGEPAYLTKELLPEYWSQITSQVVRTGSNGVTYLAFCDRTTSSYWRGTYDAGTDTLDLYLAKNESILRSFAKQNGLPITDYIPEWDLVFNPQDNVRVDFQNRIVNEFTPSEFMKQIPKNVKAVPKVIFKVIDNALGNDAKVYDHFINWLAYIVQYRDRTRTAWILHGTQGTGKGIMMNNIIRPLLGSAHTATRRMEELNEPYNHFMKNSFIVFVDEVQTKALNNERGVMAKLKNFITEEYVPIRAMYQNAHEARNYTNWIFASNMADPVAIDKNDRRFNVARYQPNKLVISDAELDQIPKELQAFHDYLYNYNCDVDKAGTPLDSSDRTTMISISESSIDTVASALLDGNFGFFIDQLPSHTVFISDPVQANRAADYKAVLLSLLVRTDIKSGRCNIDRDELRILFDYVIGNIPQSPNKFTSLLKHHRIHTEPVWVDTKTANGIKVVWSNLDLPQWNAYHTQIAPPAAPQPKLKAVK